MTKLPAETAYIGVGANLGNPAQTVEQAIARLNQLADTRVDAQSSLFRTAPIEASGSDYINAVVRIETGLAPLALLKELQALETLFGRERPYQNAPRTLDLDILLFGRQRIDEPLLIVPHPRLTQRAFALIPLLQLDPFIAIPGHGPAHGFVPDVAGQRIERL